MAFGGLFGKSNTTTLTSDTLVDPASNPAPIGMAGDIQPGTAQSPATDMTAPVSPALSDNTPLPPPPPVVTAPPAESNFDTTFQEEHPTLNMPEAGHRDFSSQSTPPGTPTTEPEGADLVGFLESMDDKPNGQPEPEDTFTLPPMPSATPVEAAESVDAPIPLTPLPEAPSFPEPELPTDMPAIPAEESKEEEKPSPDFSVDQKEELPTLPENSSNEENSKEPEVKEESGPMSESSPRIDGSFPPNIAEQVKEFLTQNVQAEQGAIDQEATALDKHRDTVRQQKTELDKMKHAIEEHEKNIKDQEEELKRRTEVLEARRQRIDKVVSDLGA